MPSRRTLQSPHLREHIALYALLTSLTAISIDALLPSLRLISVDLTTRSGLSTQHVITLFILGMSIGELLLGPLSDAIGRKKALLIGLAIYVLGTLIALTATSMTALIVGRFVQGIGVSGPKIATRAMIRDQYAGDAMARIMSLMFTLFILVPMLAPALGQAVSAVAGWRGMFVVYLCIAAGLAMWLIKRQPETLPVDLRIPLRPAFLVRNALHILSHRRVSLLIVATGIVFGAQLLYLSTAAALFFDAYGIDRLFAVYFALIAISIGLASYLNARIVARFGMELLARFAFLGLAVFGFALLIAAVVWQGQPPLPLFVILCFGAFFAIGLSFGNLNAMAMRPLGELAGLGASLVASGSSLMGVIFAAIFGAFYDGRVFYLAVGLCVAGLIALALSEYARSGDPAPVIARR